MAADRAEDGVAMWVCHCVGVTDTRIREAMAEGAVNEEQVGAHCGAGTRCGGCRDEVRRLCDEVRCDATDRMLASLAAAS